MDNGDVLSLCLAEINSRRRAAENESERRLAELIGTYPEFASIDAELKSTLGKLMSVLRDGTDIAAGIERIKKENLDAQKRKRDFLSGLGLEPSFLEPHYVCALCNDTGFHGGERCECLKKLMISAMCKRLNEASPMSLCSFDSFDLSYFEGDAAVHMRNVLDFVKKYADNFGNGSGSLLFYGNTGLGKTHLSLAVADTLIKKGFNVIYGQAQSLFSSVTDERFSRGGPSGVESSLVACDLLIIDDLGAEFVNQMSQSVLYSLINTRLLSGKSTIISTNIPLEQIDTIYHSRISSRLCFEFEPVPFVGKDVRQKRKHCL